MKQRHRKHRRPVRDVFSRRYFRAPIPPLVLLTASDPIPRYEPYTFPVYFYWGLRPVDPIGSAS